jgi:sensor histidine kinase YesM
MPRDILPKMQPPSRLSCLTEYTVLAASTVKEIAQSRHAPFLVSTAALSLMILDLARVRVSRYYHRINLTNTQASRSLKEQIIQMIEQIHEVLCAIISLYLTAAMDATLPPGLLQGVAKFTEYVGDFMMLSLAYACTRTLQQLDAYLKAQQEMGKIKLLFKHADSASQLDACKTGLQDAVLAFRVRNILPFQFGAYPSIGPNWNLHGV